jgi:single-strand DNA-binding protein
MNVCQVIGRLGKDADVRYTAAGKPVVNLSVATEEKRRDRDGNETKQTTWHDIVCFGYVAEHAQHLLKGDQVYVAGPIEKSKWQDREGKERIQVKVRGETVLQVSRPEGAGDSPPRRMSSGPAPAQRAQPGLPLGGGAPPPAEDPMDDDIPF